MNALVVVGVTGRVVDVVVDGSAAVDPADAQAVAVRARSAHAAETRKRDTEGHGATPVDGPSRREDLRPW